MSLTIDASVFVAASRASEPQYADSIAFLNRVRTQEVEVFCPTLVLVESAAAIARRTRRPRLVEHIITMIDNLLGIQFVTLDEPLSRQAAQLTKSHYLRGADAVYAAVAQVTNSTLITWDVEVLQRAPVVVPTLDPSQW